MFPSALEHCDTFFQSQISQVSITNMSELTICSKSVQSSIKEL